MHEYIIAFDIGGTRIKYGVITPGGALIHSGQSPSNSHEGPEVLLQTLTKSIDDIRGLLPGTLMGVGLGLTGAVDPALGVVLLPGKFKALEGFPIVPILKERLEVPVFADNDGRLAVYAEKYFGKAKNKDWAVVVTIGTGVGSGVILDGRILHDPHFLFGLQLGHLVMNKSSDQTCLTGNAGTGEIHCSATALALQVRSALQRGIPSLLTDAYHSNPAAIDFQKVAEACRAGDKLCVQELDVWIDNLSILLINAVHCYAPQIIILSGGATLAADLFVDRVNNRVNEKAFRYFRNEPIDMVVSDMQEFAGVMGGAAMVLEQLNKTKPTNYDRMAHHDF